MQEKSVTLIGVKIERIQFFKGEISFISEVNRRIDNFVHEMT